MVLVGKWMDLVSHCCCLDSPNTRPVTPCRIVKGTPRVVEFASTDSELKSVAASRCSRWIQWHRVRLRSDRFRKDVYDDGKCCWRSVPTHGLTVPAQGADIDNDELKGIIPRITEQIFTSIVESDANFEYLVKVSYMEIYLERIRDLMARMCSPWDSCAGQKDIDLNPIPKLQPKTIICKSTRRSQRVST